VAAVAGILVLHENFTAGMGIGFILVLAGSTLATRRARQRQPGLVEEAVTLRDR
jgi:drug/metabolite transporter (DMT)-like permease